MGTTNQALLSVSIRSIGCKKQDTAGAAADQRDDMNS